MNELMTEQEFDRFIKSAAILLTVSNLKIEIMIDTQDAIIKQISEDMDKTFADYDKRLTELETILNVKPCTKAIKRPWQDEK